jgi:tetratricopeptide (TPR) repeat protein
MKQLFLIFIFSLTCQLGIAQSKAGIDREKLLDYYQSQRYAEAAMYLQDYFKEDTQDPKALSQMAYANLMAGKLTEAEKYYLKLNTLQPNNLATLFSLASISSRRGNTEQAKTYYLEVLKNDSTSFSAYKQLADLDREGISLVRNHYLEKANALMPADPDIAFDLCEVYFKMNFFDKARLVLEPALAADSSNLRLLKMKIPINIASRNYPEAIKTGHLLLNYGDSSTFVLNNLAKSYFLSLDYPNALKYFLTIQDKAFDNEGLYYNIGLSYRGVKDFKKAIPYFEKAIKEAISPKIATYYGLLGDSYESINQNDPANKAYKKGLQFENNGSLLYNIALVYETKLNDKKNAVNYYDQYLKTINPKEQPKLISFIKNKIEELKK